MARHDRGMQDDGEDKHNLQAGQEDYYDLPDGPGSPGWRPSPSNSISSQESNDSGSSMRVNAPHWYEPNAQAQEQFQDDTDTRAHGQFQEMTDTQAQDQFQDGTDTWAPHPQISPGFGDPPTQQQPFQSDDGGYTQDPQIAPRYSNHSGGDYSTDSTGTLLGQNDFLPSGIYRDNSHGGHQAHTAAGWQNQGAAADMMDPGAVAEDMPSSEDQANSNVDVFSNNRLHYQHASSSDTGMGSSYIGAAESANCSDAERGTNYAEGVEGGATWGDAGHLGHGQVSAQDNYWDRDVPTDNRAPGSSTDARQGSGSSSRHGDKHAKKRERGHGDKHSRDGPSGRRPKKSK